MVFLLKGINQLKYTSPLTSSQIHSLYAYVFCCILKCGNMILGEIYNMDKIPNTRTIWCRIIMVPRNRTTVDEKNVNMVE